MSRGDRLLTRSGGVLTVALLCAAGSGACFEDERRRSGILEGEPWQGLGGHLAPWRVEATTGRPERIAAGGENGLVFVGWQGGELVRDETQPPGFAHVDGFARYGPVCRQQLDGLLVTGRLDPEDAPHGVHYLRESPGGEPDAEFIRLPGVEFHDRPPYVGCADTDGDGSMDIYLTGDDELHHLEASADGSFSWVEKFAAPEAGFEFEGASDAGDLNGDGFSDLIAVALDWSTWERRDYLYLGGAGGLAGTPAWTGALPIHIFDYHWAHPQSLGVGCDVNADGFDDLLAGTELFLGGPDGLGAEPDWKIDFIEQEEKDCSECWDDTPMLGFSADCAGDFDGDGFDDVVVGAPGFNDLWRDVGRVFIYPGGPEGPSREPAWEAGGRSKWEFFGLSVSFVGDLNGDGSDDLLVGAPGRGNEILVHDYGLSGNAHGRVYLFLSGPEP